ncbi:MAG: hypothetical protein ACRD4C_01545 [Candidatus Acidiferrales bacterium]
MLGTLSALWVFVEALNAREGNAGRIRNGGVFTASFMVAAGILGGFWYTKFYPADKAIILKGPWPFAHNLFMETKEHLFFLVLILALYLAIAARGKLYANSSARNMVLCVSMLIVLSGLTMEGFGGTVDRGDELALKAGVKETQNGR